MKTSFNAFALVNGCVKFNGLNYADWSEQIQFSLGVMELDLAIIMDNVPTITETSSEADKTLYEAWERSNRLSLSLMKMSISDNVKPSMPKTDNAREFMRMIKEYSQSDITDKSVVGNLMTELTTKKFDWSQPIHDHVTSMTNLTTKMKGMGMEVTEAFLVQFIINSLPVEFGQFQVNYNTIKEKWNFQEVKAMLVQEEGRLKKIKNDFIHLTIKESGSTSRFRPSNRNKGKGKKKIPIKDGKIHTQTVYHLYFICITFI
ncbi:hypothetical protein Lal_00047783 [Lupinus albus]|nr:hypothetical protein Lal_00047783 [Lupinus albus]